MCALGTFYTLSRLILPNVNIKNVSNTLSNLPTLGRLILPHTDVAEWLGSLPFKRGVLSSNSDIVAIKRLLHDIFPL